MQVLPWILIVVFYFVVFPRTLPGCHAKDDDDIPPDDPHRNPSLCEVCKYLALELKGRLDETGKTKEVLEIGYGLDEKKKKKEYKKSELRLIEALSNPHICDRILEYNIHAERKGSLRFGKGMSQTMDTLHKLVDKGVNVELGIPYEMWDKPSAGVAEMQRQCFKVVEDYETDIEEWYWNDQDKDLIKYLCEDRVLKLKDAECLSEFWTGEEKEKKSGNERNDSKSGGTKGKNKQGKKRLKGDHGAREDIPEERDEL